MAVTTLTDADCDPVGTLGAMKDACAADYAAVRSLSEALAAPLSDADATAQAMDDASPAKWHLAHTTWFFETFILRDHLPGYRPYDERFHYLFNSYYEAEGPRHPRPRRGLLTRPSLETILDWRETVDQAMLTVLSRLPEAAIATVKLGIAHEQQHQELLQTDMLALFAANPLEPAMWALAKIAGANEAPEPIRWIEGRHGIVEIGHDPDAGFGFDCEGPRHRTLLQRHALAHRAVTNQEWIGFIEDGGYSRPELWLSDGWTWVQRERIEAPLYWSRDDGAWSGFGLGGRQPLEMAAPVCHVSFYEADAYARWAGARLPTEAEWESAAQELDPRSGNQLDVAGPVRPAVAGPAQGLAQMFGDVWEWTSSAYHAHPGFRPCEGAVGEYNGKFMSGQQVLKGGSCATPRGHLRASYRNFFYPHQRWQYCGLRLARDL